MNNIFMLGKTYSTRQVVAKQLEELGIHRIQNSKQLVVGGFTVAFSKDIHDLWSAAKKHIIKNNIKRIIILDEGGLCLSSIPQELWPDKGYKIVGIEQTRAGLYFSDTTNVPILPFPVIMVAGAAAKKILEPYLIAKEAVNALDDFQLLTAGKSLKCGVIGYGSIGEAITRKLTELNHNVLVYDADFNKIPNNLNFRKTYDIWELVQESELIIGCTGSDVTANIIAKLDTLKQSKCWISLSSKDTEFLSLLRHTQSGKNNGDIIEPLMDIIYKNQAGETHKIIRGGFPVNLNTEKEFITPSDIQSTRGYLESAVLQAVDIMNDEQALKTRKGVMLYPGAVAFVVDVWTEYWDDPCIPREVLNMFQDVDWIQSQSQGDYYIPFQNTQSELEYVQCYRLQETFNFSP